MESPHREPHPRVDWFKIFLALVISIGGFFINRLVTELDEARDDIKDLQVQMSSMKTSLEFIERKVDK